MEIEVTGLQLSEEQMRNLRQQLDAEMVGTVQGGQAEAMANVKVVEETEVVQRKVKAKVTQ